jgi:hypothetical protein
LLKKDSWLGHNIHHLFTAGGAFIGLTAGVAYALAMSFFALNLVDTSISDENQKEAVTRFFVSVAPGSFAVTIVLAGGGGAYAGRKISRLLFT